MVELKVSVKKGKRYLHHLFEKWDREHLELDENFDDYLDNDGLEDIIEEKEMRNLNTDD